MKTVEVRTEQIARVHARVGRSPARPGKAEHKKHEVRRRTAKDEYKALSRLRRGKNGLKFSALYDRGDWQGQGYPSQSEADLALCAIIAARTEGDDARVDALFRQSALMRQKWDEPHFAGGSTYGEETVCKAVQGRGRRIVVPPRVSTSDSPADGDGKPLMCTDTGNAERLVRQFGDQLLFCHPWKGFLFWDRRRWKSDDRGIAMRYSKDVVRSIYQEAANRADSTLREELSSWAFKSERADRRRAMVELAKSEPAIVVTPDQIDRNHMLLNCANGTLDLRTCTLRPHSRDDHITKLCPVEYDPKATSPTWLSFLERVIPESEVRGFLQRAVGWSITGDVSEQVLLLLYGTGANGKSVFLSTLLRMLGSDYAIQAAPDLVLTRRFATHPTDIADLFGKRLVATVEVGSGKAFDEVLIKQLTGGDRIRARRMREDFWEFDPTHHLWIASNHKPIVCGTDYAIWRRILLVPFTVTIPKGERDKKLHEKLERELPGILNWAVEGCRMQQAHGLNPPEAVLLATREYRTEMNVVGRFLDERCVRKQGLKSGATVMFHAFRGWCVEAGEEALTQAKFGEAMTELGVEKRKSGGSIWYLQVALAATPGPSGEGWGGSGPNSHISDIRAPREEVMPGGGPSPPQPSPSGESAACVPREVALSNTIHRTCPACGRSRWWRRRDTAHQVCAACHPPAADIEAIYENTTASGSPASTQDSESDNAQD